MTVPSREELAGMTGGERLYAAGMADRLHEAAVKGDLKEMRAILEALDFDERSIDRTLKDAKAAYE
jgi:hypothetical protein